MEVTISIESPYCDDPGAIWLKGNLHTHTTRSDGALPPQETVDLYAARGYDFLMLSDHDTLGQPETLDGHKMLLIRGNEISAGGPHLLHVGANRFIEADENRQHTIDAVNADGGMAILCHPNWEEHFNHYPYEQLLALKDYAGIEILNGVVVFLPGEARATNKWDRLLSAGKRVWGYGNDDTHWGAPHVGIAWTVVRAKERSVPAVLEALRDGSCYVSSGVEIESIKCTGPVLQVIAPTAQAMAVYGDYGARLCYQLGNQIFFDTTAVKQSYVRVECYGLGGQTAWTQPFYIRGGKADQIRQLAEHKPTLQGVHVFKEPRLTGRLEDPAWADAPGSSRFLNLKTAEPAEVETTIKCLATEHFLFFGIRCDEPQMDQIKTLISHDGDPNTWTDDSVEIFLEPGASYPKYLHVMVSAAGYGRSAWMPGASEGPGLRIATARNQAGWTAEVAIPLASFGGKAASRHQWRLHVCRNRKPQRATYIWAWVGSSNHNPSRFGNLILPAKHARKSP